MITIPSNPYNKVALTAAINNADYIPHELETWLPWNSQGETTDVLFIEFRKDGTLEIVAEAERGGGQKDTLGREDREGVLLRVPYYPQYETLMAAAVKDVRAFGSDSEVEGYATKLAQRLQMMKNKNELTREFLRAHALQGATRKKDGSISQNLNAIFGITKTTHAFDLSAPTTDVVAELIEAVEKSEDALGQYQGLTQGYMLIAGKEIHRKLSRHASIQEAFRLWSATGGMGNLGSALRDDLRAGFPITTNVNLVSYSKGKIGNTHFLDPNKALLCPIVEGMYQTRNAPGDGKDVVNTIGLPEYVSMEPLPFNKGDNIHTEMATVSYVERPQAIVEITSDE